jgi:hypothetical protein
MRIPGPSESHCSYRSELAGIYSILKTTWSVINQHNITAGAIEIGSDSLSVLERLFVSSRPANLSDHSWDLLSASQKLLKRMPFLLITWRHIPGHQDKEKLDTKNLDIWARRNILMDERAAQVYLDIPPSGQPVFSDSEIFAVKINNREVVCNFKDAIKRATIGADILAYWASANKTGDPTDIIAWDSFGIAMADSSVKTRRWIVKQTSGRSAVGVEMKRRKQWSHSRCPRCSEIAETSQHVLQCQGHEANDVWTSFVTEFRLWLARQRTHNDIADIICSSLSAWRTNSTPPRYSGNLLGLTTALSEQQRIGWDAALEGRWAESWIAVQERHFRFLRLRRSGKRWLTAIIKQMWQVSWNLWDHRNQVQVDRQLEEKRAANAVNVHYEFSLGMEGLNNQDRALFKKGLVHILLLPLPSQDAWIRRITMARRRASTNKIHCEQQNYLNLYNLLHRLRRRGHQQRETSVPTLLVLPSGNQPLRPSRITRILRNTQREDNQGPSGS